MRSSSLALAVIGAFVLPGVWSQKIAIIGGAMSGSFTAKYLSDYDEKCAISHIHVFEPNPVTGPIRVSDLPWKDWQGSRVASLQLNDGSIVELGASIAHEGNQLILEMIDGDPSLERTQPFNTATDDEPPVGGFGVFGGTRNWPIPPHEGPEWMRTLKTILRYNFDLKKVAQVCGQAVESFQILKPLLDSVDADSFFRSPDEIWKRIGLYKAAHISFATFLDGLGIHEVPDTFRRMLFPFQGNIRDEFLTAINLVNYNQNVEQVNALVGMSSFAAATGDLFSVYGGNYQLIPSALKQANQMRDQYKCEPLEQIEKRITTVVGSLEGFQLYAGEESIGHYDVVVLASPIHASQINFLIESHNDPSILQQMPLGGLIETESDDIVPGHEGHVLFPHELPATAKRPYTQVTTTILSNASLRSDPIMLSADLPTPRSVLFTEAGKAALYNITAITKVTTSGVYKIFSDAPLPEAALTELFGPGHIVEYVKVWGGPYGGATPDYQGGGTSTEFLLYDAAHGLGGHTTSGALYYPPALELSSLACIEIAATGAKAVAKLMARRLGLLKVDSNRWKSHDEL